MKLSKIFRALAAVCGAAVSVPSFALTANRYTNAGEFVGSTLNIRIAGSSAADYAILTFALTRCVKGTVHKYSVEYNVVYFCTPNVGSSYAGQIEIPSRSPGIAQLAIYKYSIGGSSSGVMAVNNDVAAYGFPFGAYGNQLPFLDLNKLSSLCIDTFATVITQTSSDTNSLGSYVDITCSNSSSAITTPATTYIGLSDLEPAFFSNQTSNIRASSAYVLILGVPVTRNIRNALQTQQGLVSDSDTEANMPSLTSAQLVSAYTQFGQTWAGLGVTSGLTNDGIYVARRVDSSGVQKAFEALIAHTPNGQASAKSCIDNVDAFVSPDSGLRGLTSGDYAAACGGATSPLVFGGLNSRDVETCLLLHNRQGRGAIGMLMFLRPRYDPNWKFVKIDGIAPSQANAASGKYRFYTESVINIREGGAFGTYKNVASGYGAIVSRLRAHLSTPLVPDIYGNNLVSQLGGLMGLLASPGVSPDYTGVSGMMPWSKLMSGSDLNNCQSPKAVF